jgi:hypothetical protein
MTKSDEEEDKRGGPRGSLITTIGKIGRKRKLGLTLSLLSLEIT